MIPDQYGRFWMLGGIQSGAGRFQHVRKNSGVCAGQYDGVQIWFPLCDISVGRYK
jgi:hypothetical protein